MQSRSTHFNSNIDLEKRIIFALDIADSRQAKLWVRTLQEKIKFFKVGWELFLDAGFDIVFWIAEQGCEVMLDLKLFDVPRTVQQAMTQLQDKPVSLTTVHGNSAILRAAKQAGAPAGILAVTVLTSLDEQDLTEMGLTCNPQDLVLHRAVRALETDCAGVVCSGQELSLLRNRLGSDFLTVVPGVRAQAEQGQDDQKRTINVQQAFSQGADHVVLGRPLREARDPLLLATQLQNDIHKQLLKNY